MPRRAPVAAPPACLGLIGALLLAACDKPQTTLPDTAALYPIAVERRAVFLRLSPAGDGGLRWEDEAETRAFLADWASSGRGPLRVSAAAKRQEGALLADVRLAARATGADAGNLRLAAPTGDALAAYLAFEKLAAVPPDCGGEAATLAGEKNDRSAVLGCATRRNLAAMVANPSDLVVPAQASGAPFAQRRALVIENWRKGKATGAQTSEGDDSSVAFISRILGAGN